MGNPQNSTEFTAAETAGNFVFHNEKSFANSITTTTTPKLQQFNLRLILVTEFSTFIS